MFPPGAPGVVPVQRLSHRPRKYASQNLAQGPKTLTSSLVFQISLSLKEYLTYILWIGKIEIKSHEIRSSNSLV